MLRSVRNGSKFCVHCCRLCVDGISDFNALHSGQHNEEVQLCAFDILAEGDDDLRKLPLYLRKTNLERLLARRPEGIFVNPSERGAIGPDLFRAAYKMGWKDWCRSAVTVRTKAVCASIG
jgi:bifunctional non-homologous end joining protein LigD